MITGFGRCGTKFLAAQLNKSKTWEVNHEVVANSLLQSLEPAVAIAQAKFDTLDNYGEVNSYYRNTLSDFNVGVKAILLRRPREIFTSVFNWTGGKLSEVKVEQVVSGLTVVAKLIEDGYQYFLFERFIKDPQYIVDIANHVGIYDLDINDITLGSINHSQKQLVAKFSDLPINIQARCLPSIEHFETRYLNIWENAGV